MYEYEKKMNFTGNYKWGADFALHICFFPARYGCRGVGALRIRLYWEKPEYNKFYVEKIIRKDNYISCKKTIESFCDRYISKFNEQDGAALFSALCEAWGDFVLKMTDEELNF